MEISLEQRFQLYKNALTKKYIGCLFDIDGTLTVRGDEFIATFLHKPLAELSLKVPVGVCTARNFAHTYAMLAPVFEQAANPLQSQANWILICENGGVGYFFDPSSKKYQEFFRVNYSYPREHLEALYNHTNKVLKEKIGISYKNEVSLIFRPKPYDEPDREKLAQKSDELETLVAAELTQLDPKKALRLGNSRTGVIIFSALGNKENGTIQFGNFLRECKGFQFGTNFREIVVVGDQPLPGGNDETFLNGKYGTPFSVGEFFAEKSLPLPVFIADNEKASAQKI